MQQMYRINNQYRFGLKKPKLKDKVDMNFHNKVKFIRDKSFIHQDSKEISNPMDKRTAMDWTLRVSSKQGSSTTCESYRFGDGGWFVEVNGLRTQSSIDIQVTGFSDFCNKAIEQLNVRRKRASGYFQSLSEAMGVIKA
ncbi:hypothetical protein [Ferrimonas aestuarii]|uniref:Uncharacterized protein n=1 Tax=Ferrimonas aestuarii TaxID=2569539 RepID=A0A4U1BSB3_9GAMM|nr:hypothetical protein [Ferrimonas aestuarii]TKB58523.1 hypothetical protein FCL42_01895 [Ferrimonas aestuarii]